MNPYVMMLLQRIGASPVGQRGADLADRMRSFELSRIAPQIGAGGRQLPFGSIRAPDGRVLLSGGAQRAAQNIPLQPLTRGAAGLGAAGVVASGGIPQGLIEELNNGRMASPAPAQDRREPPPVRPAGEVFGPPMYANTDMSARFSDPPQQYVSSDMSARFSDPPQTPDAPPPPRRPFGVGAPPPPRRPAELSAQESLLRRIFSGQDYQSNSRPVVENRKVNWGDSENAADFFRADRAARELGTLPPVERASGGQVGQGKAHKDAALVKALEIIERLMSNGR